MDELKGVGKPLMRCNLGGACIPVLIYNDEGVGIERGGKIIGVWEPHETKECLRIFWRMCGLDEPDAVLIVRNASSQITQAMN